MIENLIHSNYLQKIHQLSGYKNSYFLFYKPRHCPENFISQGSYLRKNLMTTQRTKTSIEIILKFKTLNYWTKLTD